MPKYNWITRVTVLLLALIVWPHALKAAAGSNCLDAVCDFMSASLIGRHCQALLIKLSK
jgi:hypothetical protein